MNDKQNVVDGQIVEDVNSDSESSVQDEDSSTVVASLDEMIRLNFKRLNDLSAEQKTLKQIMDDALENSEIYKEVSEKTKTAILEKTSLRKTLLTTPEMISALNKMKDLATEIREKKTSLSDYILEFQRISGANEIDLGNGKIMQIENSAKLIRKK